MIQYFYWAGTSSEIVRTSTKPVILCRELFMILNYDHNPLISLFDGSIHGTFRLVVKLVVNKP